MFEFEDLVTFSLEIDLSKYLPSEEKPTSLVIQMLEKINLKILKPTPMISNLQIGLTELQEMIPSVEYSGTIGEHRIEMSFFEKKKIRLDIRKVKSVTLVDTRPAEMKEKEPRKLSLEEFKNIGTHFNFLFGKILGVLNLKEMPIIKASLSFSKKQNILPSKKLQIIKENICIILGHPRIDISGFIIDYFDEENLRHSLDFHQSEEEFIFGDDFEFRPIEPIVIFDIFEKSLKLVNEFFQKIGEL